MSVFARAARLDRSLNSQDLKIFELVTQLFCLGFRDCNLRTQLRDRANDVPECACFRSFAKLIERSFAHPDFVEFEGNFPIQAEKVG